ncbi:zinc finger protein RFP-like isoform X2 [Acipenser ruthenus]|uniref:zinc finger protein RFP-like isoform X1 n=1 Tax=Acipenser ruthenus TaxID=7906 RepID=UPI002741916C|nr:zinc finger protein RFP-like isoform X1 [Acipenser ruthenus]XP_058872797.1 zinc finger protein RFP-like isoform X2 [Acipenser ruthenus]
MKTKKFLILILIGVLIVCSVFSAPHLRKYDTEQKEDYRVQHGHGSSGPSGGDGSSSGPSGGDGSSSGPSGGDGSSDGPSGEDGSSRPSEETERSNNQRLQRELNELQKKYDTSQTPENQAEQGRFFEVCSTEKIVSIVLGLSLLVSLIINFVCCFKIRKRDHGRRHYDPSNEDRYQFVNDPSNEDGYQSVNETERSNNQRLQRELNELQKKYDALRKEKKQGKHESLGKAIDLKRDCDEIRKKFNAVGYVAEREWSSIVKAQAKVTLNPDTANPSLTVSPDGSQVRFKGEGSAEWPSVLSREGFTSGRHYWEVEVGEKGYWALGISTYLDEKIIPEKPEEGYWLLRRWKGNMYEAVSQSLVPLTLQHKLYKVGMILDYQKGELSFYNVYDGSTRYEIHTFNYKFTEVYPVFSPGSHDRGPLKITRFKSGDGNPNL